MLLQIHEIITCGLLCLLSCAVCIGFSIAIIAGIAYGYNYSLAEFLQFTRSDVTVFMRRGQFYDKPEMPVARRSGVGEDALFAAVNRSTDYEDAGSRSQPLADAWLQSHDTRQYAEKLTKYTPAKAVEHFVVHGQEPVQSPQIISIPPNPLLATISWQSGTSQIIMRSYKPLDDNPSDITKISENVYFLTDTPVKSIGFLGGPHKNKDAPESIDHTETSRQSPVPAVRVWSTANRRIMPEYVTEEIDDDSIVYKPV